MLFNEENLEITARRRRTNESIVITVNQMRETVESLKTEILMLLLM